MTYSLAAVGTPTAVKRSLDSPPQVRGTFKKAKDYISQLAKDALQLTPSHPQLNRDHRVVLNLPVEPCTEQSHAQKRIEYLYMTATIIQKFAVRSDGTFTEVNVEIERSRLQVGKGTFEQHAAHFVPDSGLKDDLLPKLINYIKNRKDFTPKSKEIFLLKGIREDQIDEIVESDFDSEVIEEKLGHLRELKSVLEGTRWGLVRNETDLMNRKVNLGIDLHVIEKNIRPEFLPKLYKQVFLGKITPEEMASQCQTKIIYLLEEEIAKAKLNGDLEKLQFLENQLLGTRSFDFGTPNSLKKICPTARQLTFE